MSKPQASAGAATRRLPAKWRQVFLATLALTSNVAASARKAKVDVSTAYKFRRAEAKFAREWFEALCEGYDNLEMDLLQRLRAGELDGGAAPKEKARRKFDNATAFRLLAAHRASVTRQRARREDDDEKAVLASITAKLQAMRDRQDALPALIGSDGVHRVAPADACEPDAQ